MLELLEETQDSHSHKSTDYKTPIVISEGWYRDGKYGRKFEVKIYIDTNTGEPCALVPIFVRYPPEKWVRIE